MIGPYLPYVMGASGLGLAFLLAQLVVSYLKKRTSEREAAKKPEVNPIAVAQHEADRILQSAREQAHAIVANTQAFKQELDTDAKHTLQAAVQSDAAALHGEVTALPAEYKKFLTRLETEYFGDVEKSLGQGRLNVEKYLKQKIDEEFARVKAQIEEYRLAQIQKIEALTLPTVTRLAKEVLGKSFSPQEHQEIVINALEKAKKEGMFEF